MPIIHDGVRAAQAVSLLAALATLCIFYLLCTRFVRRELALVGALVLAASPLFIQYSLMTMSESLYLFWVVLAFLLLTHERLGRGGLSLGMAAITRPEAIGIVAVLSLFKLRRPRRMLRLLGGFALIYGLGTAALSLSVGHVQLLSKSGNFGLSAQAWQKREALIDASTSELAKKVIGEQNRDTSVVANYFTRLPHELLLLNRSLLPVALLLGLFGLWKRRGMLAAALFPFLVYPAFTPRSEPRFILPFLPILILYALMAVEILDGKRKRWLLVSALSLAAGVGVWLNYTMLMPPSSDQFAFSRKAARELKSRNLIKPGEVVADRKPFFAFYAGARYVEIPVAGYEDVMEYLGRERVRYLMLDKLTIHALRPALRPLMYDRAAINGELRFSQIYVQPEVAVLYRRNLATDPLTMTRLTPEGDRGTSVPPRSPDGRFVAYRAADPGDRSHVCIWSVDDDQERTVFTQSKYLDVFSWSPDGNALALSVVEGGNVDLALYDLRSEKLARITSDPADDISPSWSPDGQWIAFSSQRSGSSEIWLKNLQSGELRQLTKDGDNGFPSFSPAGDRIAWTRRGDGIHLLDLKSGATKRLKTRLLRSTIARPGIATAVASPSPPSVC